MKDTKKWRDSITTHSLSGTKIYRKLEMMKDRCYNKNRKHNSSYRRKGITICDEWRNDPLAFATWAFANGFEEHLTIDRIDNDGNYEPNNCQWITLSENVIKDQLGKFKFDKPTEVVMIEMYSNGYSLREIGASHDVGHGVISRIMKRNGIEIIKRTNNKKEKR